MILIKLVEKVKVLIACSKHQIHLVSRHVLSIIPISHFKVEISQKRVRNWQVVNDILRVVQYFRAIEVCLQNWLRVRDDLLR